jgi:hypothetical protein
MVINKLVDKRVFVTFIEYILKSLFVDVHLHTIILVG